MKLQALICLCMLRMKEKSIGIQLESILFSKFKSVYNPERLDCFRLKMKKTNTHCMERIYSPLYLLVSLELFIGLKFTQRVILITLVNCRYSGKLLMVVGVGGSVWFNNIFWEERKENKKKTVPLNFKHYPILNLGSHLKNQNDIMVIN